MGFDKKYAMTLTSFIGISIIIKVFLHQYVAGQNGEKLTISVHGSSLDLFWFYTKPVQKEHTKKKIVVNILFAIFLVFSVVQIGKAVILNI